MKSLEGSSIVLLLDSAVMFIFLDGLFRLFMPLLVIALDYKFTKFGRKMQFVGSLGIPLSPPPNQLPLQF